MPILFTAWYLASPPLLAMALAGVARRGVEADTAPAAEAVRHHGRLLGLPWLLYLANLFAAAVYVGSGALQAPAQRVGTSVLMGLGLAVGLLPTLFLSLVTRSWARRVGHPAGAVGIGVESRAWLVHVGLLAAVLGVTWSAMSLLAPAAAVAGAAAVIVAYSVVYPHVLAWIWRAAPLADDEIGRRVRSMLERHSPGIRKAVVVPTEHAPTGNAFATGVWPGGRWLFVTETLLRRYSPEEVSAVVAHEIGHLRSHHVLRASAATLAAAAVVASVLATLVAVAVPDDGALRTSLFAATGLLTSLSALSVGRRMQRRFEFQADDFAAGTLGSGAPLAAALRRLARDNWLPRGDGDPGPFASHPRIARRIARLEARSATSGFEGR